MDPINPNNTQPPAAPINPASTADNPPVPSPSAVVATTATTPPLNPPVPGNNVTQPMPTGSVEKKSNALLYIFIGVLIIVLIALMGLFFYNRLAETTSAENKIVVPTTEPMATPTVVIPTYSSQEEKDAMGVDVGGVDSQLQIIEQDINKL